MGIDRVNVTKRSADRPQPTQSSGSVCSTGRERPPATGKSKMKELDRFSSQIEESRTKRLNEVRQKLESGTYRGIPSRTLARKLIDSNRK